MINISKFVVKRTIPYLKTFMSFSTNKKIVTQQTGQQALDRSHGLAKFMRKSYMYAGGGIITSLLAANAINSIAPGNYGLMLGGSIAGFISAIAVSFMTPTYVQQKIDGYPCIVAKDTLLRKTLYWSSVIGLGMSLAPIMKMANFVDPNILYRALISTSITFVTISALSLKMPKSSMLKYGSVLMGGLISLILLQLANYGAFYFYGPNSFSNMARSIDIYGGIGLFTLLIAYDTHVAIKMYQSNTPDHLGISLQLYLDFINLFRRILYLMINRSNE